MRRKKKAVKKRSHSSKLKKLVTIAIVLFSIPLTLYLMQNEQRITQNAQTAISPTFFCAGNCPTLATNPSGIGSDISRTPSPGSSTGQGNVNGEPCARDASVEDHASKDKKKHKKSEEGSIGNLIKKIIELLEKIIAQLTGKEGNPPNGATQKNDKPKTEKPKKKDKPCPSPKPSKAPEPSQSSANLPSASPAPSMAPSQLSIAPAPSLAPSRTAAPSRAAAAPAAGGSAPAPAKTVPPPPAANTAKWDEVAKCESGGKWDINTGNGYYGGLQFSPSTWKANGGTQFAATANLATKAQQIQVAERVLKTQGKKAWPKCGKNL